MKSSIITKEKSHIDYADEVMRFTFKVGAVACALVGIWAFACLVAGHYRAGMVGKVKVTTAKRS